MYVFKIYFTIRFFTREGRFGGRRMYQKDVSLKGTEASDYNCVTKYVKDIRETLLYFHLLLRDHPETGTKGRELDYA